ncbi:MAG: ABC transporter [Verrucomicrobiales bacterium]|nr:ABC transporter [Verrucomicrobiales bacterium]|tara:strand:- start:8981 stop:9673 length:693 start_codon:yes stop_codon:yes gene_type:complete
MSESPLLRLQDVEMEYASTEGGEKLSVLRGVNLEISSAETISIVGPSGSGKSTLLNIIGTLDMPSKGSVELEGQDLTNLGDEDLATLRNEKIGFIFQSHHLLPQCTVLENVLVPTIPSGKNDEAAVKRARRLLERVGLQERLHHRPGQLSGGERQRVAVVRALINAPRLVLADEPTGALDRSSAENLGALLLELNKEENVTFIVVTHSLELAKKMGRAYELIDGKLVESK